MRKLLWIFVIILIILVSDVRTTLRRLRRPIESIVSSVPNIQESLLGSGSSRGTSTQGSGIPPSGQSGSTGGAIPLGALSVPAPRPSVSTAQPASNPAVQERRALSTPPSGPPATQIIEKRSNTVLPKQAESPAAKTDSQRLPTPEPKAQAESPVPPPVPPSVPPPVSQAPPLAEKQPASTQGNMALAAQSQSLVAEPPVNQVLNNLLGKKIDEVLPQIPVGAQAQQASISPAPALPVSSSIPAGSEKSSKEQEAQPSTPNAVKESPIDPVPQNEPNGKNVESKSQSETAPSTQNPSPPDAKGTGPTIAAPPSQGTQTQIGATPTSVSEPDNNGKSSLGVPDIISNLPVVGGILPTITILPEIPVTNPPETPPSKGKDDKNGNGTPTSPPPVSEEPKNVQPSIIVNLPPILDPILGEGKNEKKKDQDFIKLPPLTPPPPPAAKDPKTPEEKGPVVPPVINVPIDIPIITPPEVKEPKDSNKKAPPPPPPITVVDPPFNDPIISIPDILDPKKNDEKDSKAPPGKGQPPSGGEATPSPKVPKNPNENTPIVVPPVVNLPVDVPIINLPGVGNPEKSEKKSEEGTPGKGQDPPPAKGPKNAEPESPSGSAPVNIPNIVLPGLPSLGLGSEKKSDNAKEVDLKNGEPPKESKGKSEEVIVNIPGTNLPAIQFGPIPSDAKEALNPSSSSNNDPKKEPKEKSPVTSQSPPTAPILSNGGLLNQNAATFAAPPPEQNVLKQENQRPDNGILQVQRPGATTGGEINANPLNFIDNSAGGERLKAILPGSDNYDGKPVASMPANSPILYLSILRSCGDICNPPPNSVRDQFAEVLTNDIVKALQDDGFINVSKDNVRLMNVAEIGGNIAAQIGLVPSDSDGSVVEKWIASLRRQLADENSSLRKGAITKDLDPSVFAIDAVGPITNDGRTNTGNKMDTATIVYISVGVYCALMFFFIGAYRAYVNRVKEEELDARKKKMELRSWYKSIHVPIRQHDSEGFFEEDGINTSEQWSLHDGSQTNTGSLHPASRHLDRSSPSALERVSSAMRSLVDRNSKNSRATRGTDALTVNTSLQSRYDDFEDFDAERTRSAFVPSGIIEEVDPIVAAELMNPRSTGYSSSHGERETFFSGPPRTSYGYE